MSDPADIQRLFGDMIRLGTIDSVNRAKQTCRFRTGDIVTGDIPWLAARSGTTKIWSPPSFGEQGVLFCPEGDTRGGFVMLGLFSDAHPAPTTDDVDLVEYPDGARIGYDASAHALTATLPAGATMRIDASGGVSIKGPVTIDGPLTVTQTIAASGEVTGKDIALSSHKHGLVKTGTDTSGLPQ